ncbi:MAG: di-heme oxidoredictase family protein [Rubripirellula sp.]
MPSKWSSSKVFLPSLLFLSSWLWLLPPVRAEHPPFANGEQIFRHQWQHESARQPTSFEPPVSILRLFANRREQTGDGLGPMHNATSCEACHTQGGSSGAERNVTLLTLDPRVEFSDSTFRGSPEMRDALLELYPAVISPIGNLEMNVVVHEKSSRPFYDSIRKNILKWVPGSVPEGWFISDQRTPASVAERPVLAGRKGAIDFYLSQRNSPPLFGLGLIDLIEVRQLHKIARSQSRRTNGQVSGRTGVGKFGWRGQSVSLDQFVRGACAGELGLQVEGMPQPPDVADETYVSFGVDVREAEVGMLVNYIRDLPTPMKETVLPAHRAVIRQGQELFAKIGCSICHVENVLPARGIYSDLLLHDMGSLLAAPAPTPLGAAFASAPRLRLPRFSRENPSTPNFFRSVSGYYGTSSSALPLPYRMTRPVEPRFPRGKLPESAFSVNSVDDVRWDVLQREWRTPPLWGVADSAPYLHDGRSDTLDSAIRWHGGEASQAAKAYRSLRSESREQILAFLGSLRAPVRSMKEARVQANKEDSERASEDSLWQPPNVNIALDVFNPF